MSASAPVSALVEIKPHQVTPELLEAGNRLLRESGEAGDRARQLQASASELEKLAEKAWAESSAKLNEARAIFLGPSSPYARPR